MSKLTLICLLFCSKKSMFKVIVPHVYHNMKKIWHQKEQHHVRKKDGKKLETFFFHFENFRFFRKVMKIWVYQYMSPFIPIFNHFSQKWSMFEVGFPTVDVKRFDIWSLENKLHVPKKKRKIDFLLTLKIWVFQIFRNFPHV